MSFESDPYMAASLIVGRELTSYPLIFAQVTTADRRISLGDGLFEQCLAYRLIFNAILFNGCVEHFSCRRFHNIAYIATIVSGCQRSTSTFSSEGSFESAKEKRLFRASLSGMSIYTISSMRPVLSTALSMRSG